MTLPLWGQLQKSQDDPETIEEAIGRLISEHEADPEAHLGDGESLSEHKHEAVIDHPAGSVPADKYARAEYILSSPFYSTSFLSVGGEVGVTFPRLSLNGGFNNSAAAYAAMTLPADPNGNRLTSEFILRSYLKFEAYQENGFLQFGLIDAFPLTSTNPVQNGFYFSWEDGHLLARVKYSSYNEFEDLGEFSEDWGPSQYEVFYTAIDQFVRFFIDGVQVASFDLSSAPSTMNINFVCWRGYSPDEEESLGMEAYDIFFARRDP